VIPIVNKHSLCQNRNITIDWPTLLIKKGYQMAAHNSSKIGVSTATIIGMNAMIGAGIFAVPAMLAKNVGPAGVLAFLFVIISVWFVAQSLSRVAQLFPEEGSFYTYTKKWAGHTVGILSSFSYLAGLLIALGLLCQLTGQYLHYFFPNIPEIFLGFITLVTIVVINAFGVSFSQFGQRILIVCTIFPILTIIAMCLSKIDISLLTPFAPHGITNVLKATRIIIFGFFGFECAASLFNVVKDPEKNVPKALTYSIFLVGTLYILFVGSIILSTPPALFGSDGPLPDVLKINFPNHPWLVTAINFSILSAILGTIHSMVWTSSNLLISIFKKLKSSFAKHLLATGVVNKTTSVLFVGTCILISFLTIKNLNLFFNLTAIFIVFAYVTSIITLLTIKQEWKSKQNIKTILGILTASVIFIFALQGIIEEIMAL